MKRYVEKNTLYDLEQSMGVKLENLLGQTSSTKPHSAGSAGWTPWYAILIFQQSMMVYSVGFGFGFGFCFIILGEPGADSILFTPILPALLLRYGSLAATENNDM